MPAGKEWQLCGPYGEYFSLSYNFPKNKKNLVNYDLHTKLGNLSLNAKVQNQSSSFLDNVKSLEGK